MRLNTKENVGKIITVVGSPASGKTFLVEKLTSLLDAKAIYHHPEEGFPDEIKRNLQLRINLFETIIWFRNWQILNYRKAVELSYTGNLVIMDAPFYYNQLFVELYVKDLFYRNALYAMGDIDFSCFSMPEITIYITTTAEKARGFLKKRASLRSWENREWVDFITNMPELVDDYISKISWRIPNLLVLYREDFDFAIENDVMEVIKLLDL